MDNLDLRSLRVLEEIFRTGSISRAAEQLQLSQPAISMTLAKLRTHFHDKLFVRVGNEMKPTPQAEGLRDHVLASIAALEATLQYRSGFTPETTDRHFRIALSDIGQIIIMPRLLARFRREAPLATIELANLGPDLPEQLQVGSVDLAVGLAPTMPSSFLQRTVYDEGFCVIARSDHPRIDGALTLAQFEAERHVQVIPSVATQFIIERALEAEGIHRIVEIQLPNFLMVAKLVAESDYLSVVPRRAGLALAKDYGFQTLVPPVTIPSYKVRQYWHDRQSADGAHKWLRDLVLQLFTES